MNEMSREFVPVRTIIVQSDVRGTSWYVRTFLTYLAAPCLAAAIILLVELARDYPTAAATISIFAAGIVGPAVEQILKRLSRARINEVDATKFDTHEFVDAA